METFFVLIEFFGGIIFFFGISWLIGYFLKLDKWREYNQSALRLKQKRKQ